MKKLISLILLLSFGIKAQEIKIGDQTWTTKNLDVTTYRNGDSIPQVQDARVWASLTNGAWCYFENKTANGNTYGKLYNWHAVNDPRGLAPKGFHLPTDEEWRTLTDFLGGEIQAENKMKSIGGWEDSGIGTNTSGFSGLPGGFRDSDGTFEDVIGSYGYWWSSSEKASSIAFARNLGFNPGDAHKDNLFPKLSGFSVRCLRGLKPDAADTYINRGLAKSHLQDYTGAIADYNKAIQLNPNYDTAYDKRGNAKAALKDYIGAIEDYNKTIQLNSKYDIAYVNRGLVKYYLQDYIGSIADYSKGILLNPYYALAYNNRGLAKYYLQDYRGAISDYSKAIQLNPDYADAYNNRGCANLYFKDYTEAIADYNIAIQLNPDNDKAYYNRGNAKYYLDDKNGACKDWSKAGEFGYSDAYTNIKNFCQ